MKPDWPKLIKERLEQDRKHRAFVNGIWIIITSVILFALIMAYV